jgi:hypothetical protein
MGGVGCSGQTAGMSELQLNVRKLDKFLSPFQLWGKEIGKLLSTPSLWLWRALRGWEGKS